jgi:hypothetical protein
MATEKQIAANRANALKSTGPRSAEGKAISSRNALKTGIYAPGTVLWCENPNQLEHLEILFATEYRPATPTERSLVDILVQNEWMLRRYRWLETETWRAGYQKLTRDQIDATKTGFIFIQEPDIAKIHRLRLSYQRKFMEALKQLREVQANRDETIEYETDQDTALRAAKGLPPLPPEPEPEPEPAIDAPAPPEAPGTSVIPPAIPDSIPQPVATKPASHQIGFVPSNLFSTSLDPARPAVPPYPIAIRSATPTAAVADTRRPKPAASQPSPAPWHGSILAS